MYSSDIKNKDCWKLDSNQKKTAENLFIWNRMFGIGHRAQSSKFTFQTTAYTFTKDFSTVVVLFEARQRLAAFIPRGDIFVLGDVTADVLWKKESVQFLRISNFDFISRTTTVVTETRIDKSANVGLSPPATY